MIPQKTVETISKKYDVLKEGFNERSKRHWAASEAMVLGYGGVSAVHRATGIAISTIRIGLSEFQDPDAKWNVQRVRRKGGGRKKITEKNKAILKDLERAVSTSTRGDPESPLLWVIKSLRNLADELKKKGHKVSHVTIGSILKELGFTLQSNAKKDEGVSHKDRDEQFRYISKESKKHLEAGDPVISVDTKKKELVGNFKNNGKTWLPKGKPIEVNVYDFPSKAKGKAIPYGVYDIFKNDGYVNVGIDHDTAEFATESIRRWWKYLGKKRYLKSKTLMITADAGGSNGWRSRLWKKELKKFADEIKKDIVVCHFPPGTSKWNKIEHRLFSFISTNWRGRPLTSYKVVINLIASTKTKTGLKVYAVLDDNEYELGKKVSDEEMNELRIDKHKFHGEWNYTIKTRS